MSIITSCLLPLEKPPAAIAFLAGVCEDNLLDYEILDLNLYIKNQIGDDLWNESYTVMTTIEGPENKLLLDSIVVAMDSAITKIIDHQSDLLAINVFSYQQATLTRIFLEKIKAKLTIPVIIGGPGISYEVSPHITLGKFLLDKDLIDYYVLGEGDLVLPRFINGVHELGLNAKGNKESWAVQIDDLDHCAIPSYKKINFKNYDPGINIQHTISITGSRGCVRRCTFCDVGHIWKKFRFRSSDNIVKEITKHVQDTGVRQFMFTDSLINGSLKQFTDMMITLSDLKIKYPEFTDIKYVGQFIVRPKEQHKESLYRLMKDSGCHNIMVGVESGSDAVRFHMGKKFTNTDIDYHLDMCSKYKIRNTFLMMSGYPTETLQDHQDTISMFRRYQKYLLDETIINVTLYQPYVFLKNTPIDLMKHELGITLIEENYGTYFFDVKTNPDLTIKERFRRYIEITKLILDLKYPGSWADLGSLRKHINNLVNLNKVETYEY